MGSENLVHGIREFSSLDQTVKFIKSEFCSCDWRF